MPDPIILPMLAETAEPRQISTGMFITSDRWLFQPKVDGERRLIICDGKGGVKVLNRDGLPTHLPQAIAQVLAKVNLPVVLDGELLDGVLFIWDVPQFPAYKISETTRCLDRVTMAFGLTHMLGSDLIRSVPTALDADGKRAMVQRVLDGQGEGIMAKLVASKYEHRRSRSWRKVKVMHEIDCVVAWLGTDKANMGLFVYDHAGRQIDVGEVGRGSADGERVREGDVVSVRIVHVSDDNRLVQPTLPKRRSDKAPAACTVDQLDAARTNKNLLRCWSDAA